MNLMANYEFLKVNIQSFLDTLAHPLHQLSLGIDIGISGNLKPEDCIFLTYI